MTPDETTEAAREALAADNTAQSSTVANLQLIEEDMAAANDQQGQIIALLGEQNRLLRQIVFGMTQITGADLAKVSG